MGAVRRPIPSSRAIARKFAEIRGGNTLYLPVNSQRIAHFEHNHLIKSLRSGLTSEVVWVMRRLFSDRGFDTKTLRFLDFVDQRKLDEEPPKDNPEEAVAAQGSELLNPSDVPKSASDFQGKQPPAPAPQTDDLDETASILLVRTPAEETARNAAAKRSTADSYEFIFPQEPHASGAAVFADPKNHRRFWIGMIFLLFLLVTMGWSA